MNLFDIISTVIVGGIAGYLASIIVGTNQEQGCLVDIIVGVIGGFIGSFVRTILLPGGVLGIAVVDTIIFATIGAIILLFVLQALFGGRRRRRRR